MGKDCRPFATHLCDHATITQTLYTRVLYFRAYHSTIDTRKSSVSFYLRRTGLGFSFCTMCMNIEKSITTGHVPDSPSQPDSLCTWRPRCLPVEHRTLTRVIAKSKQKRIPLLPQGACHDPISSRRASRQQKRGWKTDQGKGVCCAGVQILWPNYSAPCDTKIIFYCIYDFCIMRHQRELTKTSFCDIPLRYIFGGRYRTWTCDPPHVKRMLFQLS